jgi:hypothetical protein
MANAKVSAATLRARMSGRIATSSGFRCNNSRKMLPAIHFCQARKESVNTKENPLMLNSKFTISSDGN